MARFKKMRRYARKAFRKGKSYSKSSSSLSVIETAVGSAAYGYVRQPLANMVPDMDALGAYSDNVVLGGIGALAAWKGKGIVKKAGMIVLANEAFIASSKAKVGMTPSTTQQSGYVYG